MPLNAFERKMVHYLNQKTTIVKQTVVQNILYSWNAWEIGKRKFEKLFILYFTTKEEF